MAASTRPCFTSVLRLLVLSATIAIAGTSYAAPTTPRQSTAETPAPTNADTPKPTPAVQAWLDAGQSAQDADCGTEALSLFTEALEAARKVCDVSETPTTIDTAHKKPCLNAGLRFMPFASLV